MFICPHPDMGPRIRISDARKFLVKWKVGDGKRWLKGAWTVGRKARKTLCKHQYGLCIPPFPSQDRSSCTAPPPAHNIHRFPLRMSLGSLSLSLWEISPTLSWLQGQFFGRFTVSMATTMAWVGQGNGLSRSEPTCCWLVHLKESQGMLTLHDGSLLMSALLLSRQPRTL